MEISELLKSKRDEILRLAAQHRARTTLRLTNFR
jgi:hypothetical protein